jgi:hypothetical protein
MSREKLNVNSGFLLILTLIVAIAGWSLNRNFNALDEGQKELKQIIMPRQEVELQLETLRARINGIELEVSKIKAKSP